MVGIACVDFSFLSVCGRLGGVFTVVVITEEELVEVALLDFLVTAEEGGLNRANGVGGLDAMYKDCVWDSIGMQFLAQESIVSGRGSASSLQLI